MRHRILHLADLHLGDRHDYLGDGAAARQMEADGLLDRVVDHVLADASSIGAVIIAGDLFDHFEPEAILVDRVIRALGRLADAGIEILTVPGNHDEISYPTSVYRTHGGRWPGVLVTRPDPGRVASWTLGDRKVDVYAMAFVAGRSRAPFDRFEVQDPSAFNVAVFHGSLDLQSGDRSIPLSGRNLEAVGLDYVALGHIHAPSERRLGRGRAAYPGRIEGGGFDDPGGAPLLEVEITTEGPRLHRTPFPARPIETIDLPLSTSSAPPELEARLERLAAGMDGNRGAKERIVRLRLRGVPAFALDPSALHGRWAAKFHYLDLDLPAEETSIPDLEGLARETTVRGRFVRIALERIEALDGERERRVAEIALREGLAAFGSGS